MLLLSNIVERRVSHLLLRQLKSIKLVSTANTKRVASTVTRAKTNNTTTIGDKMSGEPFSPRKALVLRKFSRLEYEKLCHPNLSEAQLAENVSVRPVQPGWTRRKSSSSLLPAIDD